jgi:hypothetical protein
MLIKVIILILFSSSWLLLKDCSSMKYPNPEVFKLSNAYYQTWVVSDDGKGTDIVLTLKDVHEGVEFDSIVFSGIRFKAFTTKSNNEVSIKSILPSGASRIKLNSKVVNLQDQLIYHFQGERKSFLLQKIEQKSSQFYKIK